MKTGYLLVHIPATHHCGRRYYRMGGGRGLMVLEVNLTPELGFKLKGLRKTIKFGSDTFLVPSLL